MKIITTPKKLENEFLKSLESYSNYYWTTAWASSKSKPFKKLLENQDKIKKIVVGIHFYQTHPEFIETLIDNENVRFIKQPKGTFHPKLFLFYNNLEDWNLIVGSANFTNSAFTENTEVSTVITSKDLNSKKTLETIFDFIENKWEEAKYFDRDELENYKTVWQNHKPKLNSLSGNYGNSSNKKSKPIHLASIINMKWEEFVEKVENSEFHSLKSRIGVLEVSNMLFHKVNSFSELSKDERKFIAGVPNKLVVDEGINWAYFGSMRGNGIFNKEIGDNNIELSNALDEIPLFGQITKVHYLRFLKHFTKVFAGKNLITASRLLAMKRPDVFVCLSSKNKAKLCKNFGVIQSSLDYEKYWEDIILRIYDSEWWLNSKPKTETERKISQGRSAFLDALYYEE
ncbi:phospholipase D family protein [uncultured Tenacibaculum sp.]|uniref:phospholipase D family protein n=1 Tax=uncultured Tenacibaculum sp. TaxID=174713 RepID=UPI00260B4DAE|nr:phospholipase D family protein [uncultured Tenacibaculum sp.]